MEAYERGWVRSRTTLLSVHIHVRPLRPCAHLNPLANSLQVVVVSHRPIYLGGKDTSGGLMQRLQEDLEPLFVDNGVDLVLTAHEHEYVRMCALKGGLCDGSGPTYIVDGTAGAYTANAATGEGYNCTLPAGPFTAPIVAEDCMVSRSTPPTHSPSLPHCLQYHAPLLLIIYHPSPSPSPSLSPSPLPPPNTHRDRKWGWSRLEASATELTWKHLRWLTGEVGDEVTITKKAE